MAPRLTRFRTAILADDFRLDAVGKGIWTGTYGGIIGSATFPTQNRYWFVFVLDLLLAGKGELMMKLHRESGEVISQVTAQFESDEVEDNVVMPVGPIQFELKEPTRIFASVKEREEEEWEEVAAWTFRELQASHPHYEQARRAAGLS